MHVKNLSTLTPTQIFQFVYATQYTENTFFLRTMKTGKLLRPFLIMFPILKSGVFSAVSPAVQTWEEKWKSQGINAEHLCVTLTSTMATGANVTCVQCRGG